MNPSKAVTAQKNEPSNLREKVDHLSAQNNLGTVPAIQLAAHSLNRIQRQEAPAVVEAAPSASPSADAAPANSPVAGESPSPSPGADAQLQAQMGNPGEYPVAEPIYPNPYAYHQAMYEMAREEAAREVASKSGSSAGGGGGAAALDPALGQTATGQLIQRPKGQVLGAINIAAGGNTISVNSNLSSQDTQMLLAANIKASVPNQQLTVTARKSDGSLVQNATVWSNRWDLDEGVKTDASFVARSNSDGYPIQFEVGFSLETQNSTALPVQFTFKPTDSKATNDVVDGKPVRVFTFSRSEIAIRQGTSNNETLLGVSGRLEFDLSNGAPVLLKGTLSFHRSGVKTGPNPWDPAPVQSADQLVVDQLPLSIKLEKSP